MNSNTRLFDLQNFVPLCINVEKHRMFKDVVIPLHPSFSFERQDRGELVINKKQDFVNLTDDYKLNIIALCGLNGAGKSTIIDMLSWKLHSEESKFELYFMDINGNILSTSDKTIKVDGGLMEINQEMRHIDSIRAMCGNESEREPSNHYTKGLVNSYIKHKEIYDTDHSVFTHYTLEINKDNPDYSVDFFNSNWRPIFDTSSNSVEQLFKNNPSTRILTSLIIDPIFRDWINKNFSQDTEPTKQLESIILNPEIIKIERQYIELMERERPIRGEDNLSDLLDEHNNDFKVYHTLEVFDEIYEKLSLISHKLGKAVAKHLREQSICDLNLDEEALNLIELSIFIPQRQFSDNSYIDFHHVSDGEYRRILNIYSLIPRVIQSTVSWFYYDEPGRFSHPEWERQFVGELLNSYQKIASRQSIERERKNIADRTLTCIIATHSPFVLSDLPSDNVVYLDKTEKQTNIISDLHPTFAANIGELFHTGFFMKKTIGEFASQTIKKCITELESTITDTRKAEIAAIFNRVGDPILKKLLLEKLENAAN